MVASTCPKHGLVDIKNHYCPSINNKLIGFERSPEGMDCYPGIGKCNWAFPAHQRGCTTDLFGSGGEHVEPATLFVGVRGGDQRGDEREPAIGGPRLLERARERANGAREERTVALIGGNTIQGAT